MAAPHPTPGPHQHPLRSPLWLVFALGMLAIPIAVMVPDHLWHAPPPLPHLARLPELPLVQSNGEPVLLRPGSPMFVDVTAEPCGPPCAARTGVLAALAHSDSPPAMLSVLITQPQEHPALLASELITQWRVAWPPAPPPSGLTEIQDAWVAARAHRAVATLPTGGVMLVDGNGSVRGVYAASDDGIRSALNGWSRLLAESGRTH